MLADEPGLDGAKRIVRRLVINSGVHALLMYGAPGAGQERVANALAKAWLCTSPNPDGPCEECQACRAFGRGNNPDYQLVKPAGAGQQIKQGAIFADRNPDIKTVPVCDFVRTAPLMSRHKVSVFHSADKMNKAAANAFLKTLEEPQPYVRFVLVTDAVGRILPTVLSRCVSVSCEMGSAEELAKKGELFVVAPHFADRLTPEAFEAFKSFALNLSNVPLVGALKLAEDIEELSESLSTEDGTGRQAIADAVELLAILTARHYPGRPDWMHLILDAHRRILGNVHSGRVLDALFTAMLS